MKKILWYSDSPALETGFAQVAKKIIAGLLETGLYEIEVVGVEHFFDKYDKKKYPYKIHNAKPHDRYQSELFIKALNEWEFDILFTFHNLGFIGQFAPYIESARQKKKFKWINYSPIDNDTIQPNEIISLALPDVAVVYTKYGKKVVEKYNPELAKKVKIIYHGTEPEDFYPIDRKGLKKEVFGLEGDPFIVTNVNRNQWRKHLGATMKGFKIFKSLTKADAKLYLHAKVEDAGGDLTRQALNLGLEPDDVIISAIEDEGLGVPREGLNKIYNASDVIVTTTLGEGWGLSTTEAMCAEVPFIGPRNSSLVEIIGEKEERGLLSLMTEEWIIPYGHANIPYKLPNIDSFVNKLVYTYENHKNKNITKRVAKARLWCEKHTWEIVCNQWKEVFASV